MKVIKKDLHNFKEVQVVGYEDKPVKYEGRTYGTEKMVKQNE